MRLKHVLFTMVLWSAPVSVWAEKPPTTDKTQKTVAKATRTAALHAQIDVMITALDTEDIKKIIEFIRAYALIPALQNKELTAQQKEKELNEIAEYFKGDQQKLLQKVLVVCRSLTPSISKDQKTYTFSVAEAKIEDLHTDEIIFVFDAEKNHFLVSD